MSAALDTFAMLRRGRGMVDAVLYLPDRREGPGTPRTRPTASPSPASGEAHGTSPARRPSTTAPAPGRYLPCPECARQGRPGRIGSRRTECAACNRFAAAVRADERRRALASLPDTERQRHHDAAELAVYARQHPGRHPNTTAPPEEAQR